MMWTEPSDNGICCDNAGPTLCITMTSSATVPLKSIYRDHDWLYKNVCYMLLHRGPRGEQSGACGLPWVYCLTVLHKLALPHRLSECPYVHIISSFAKRRCF